MVVLEEKFKFRSKAQNSVYRNTPQGTIRGVIIYKLSGYIATILKL
jgi:hypothetical protein